jgi:hypothetical protein
MSFIYEDLKKMKPHEIKHFDGELEILRVYGGWIYTQTKRIHCNGTGEQLVMTSTFVPDGRIKNWGVR